MTGGPLNRQDFEGAAIFARDVLKNEDLYKRIKKAMGPPPPPGQERCNCRREPTPQEMDFDTYPPKVFDGMGKPRNRF